ncbi:MAG: Inositol 2-dehydrogenase [candidate division BRC1 bacterium ADurb.BinA364]|nr:MAG: Inositol 2-dehydrogenase [candidate division BRC1 bacterium ADurb.BinA364]
MMTMIEAEQPDGVIICVGPEAHAELAPRVLRMGIPVYTEKPPAPDARGALEVARVARESGALCMTAFKKRYSAAYVRAKEFIREFPPKDLYSLSVDYCSAQYRNHSPRNLFLLDFAIHMIDLAHFLFGEPESVFAFAKGEDAFAVSVRFANGAVGSLNLNDGRSFGIPTEEVEITARGGNFMSIHNSSCWKIARNGQCAEWREPPTFVSGGDSGNDTGHLAELAAFILAIQGQGETKSPIFESYKTMVFYEAIRESAKLGIPVRTRFETI